MTKVKYLDAMEDIRDKIECCTYLPGDMLPAESTLCSQYNISRTSLRKGLAILTERGYVSSVPGKGYFVQKQNTDKYTLCFNECGFLDKNIDEIVRASTEVVTANERIARRFGVDIGEKIVIISQIYYNQKTPFAYDIKYYNMKDGQKFLDDENLSIDMRKEAGDENQFFKRKNMNIWAEMADEKAKAMLGLKGQHSILVLEQQNFDIKDKPISWSRLFIIAKYSLIASSTIGND